MNSSELSWCFKDLSCKITSFFFCAFWIRNASGSTVPLKFFAVKIYNLMVGLHFKSFFFQSKPNPLNLWRDLSGFSYFVLHLSSFSFWVPIVHLKIIVCCIFFGLIQPIFSQTIAFITITNIHLIIKFIKFHHIQMYERFLLSDNKTPTKLIFNWYNTTNVIFSLYIYLCV